MEEGQAGRIDSAKRAAELWAAEDDLGSEESKKAVNDYRVSEMRKLVFTFACVVAAVIVAERFMLLLS